MRVCFNAAESGRLDKLLADNSKLSRKRATRLIERGAVRVNDRTIKRASFVVQAGARVETAGKAIAADAPQLPERYRDPWVVVIDKPFGLPSQPSPSGGADVYSLLAARERYVGLHHRLDTPASGLLLLTLNKSANAPIAAAFREGHVHRSYRVVVLGDPGPEGRWTTPIDDRPAATRFRRLSSGGGMSVLDVQLETGRTHQIRRHATDAGHPVIGDRRHGGATGGAWPRLALHAFALEFDHPISDTPVRVESSVPDDLAELFVRAGTPAAAE